MVHSRLVFFGESVGFFYVRTEENKETGHMDDIWQTVEDRANAEVQKHNKKEEKER